IECYYLASKYQEVIDIFETSHLLDATPEFPAFGQLLTMLYDSYLQLGLTEKACRLLAVIEMGNPEVSHKLKSYVALTNADFVGIQLLGFEESLIIPYELEKKSVKKAKMLN